MFILEFLRGADGFAAFAAARVGGEPPGDAAEPGAQLFGFAELAQFLPRGDEDFLREVFAAAQAAGGIVGQRANERLVARDDFRKSASAIREAAFDEFSIAGGGDGGGGHGVELNHSTCQVVAGGEKVTGFLCSVFRAQCSGLMYPTGMALRARGGRQRGRR